ncbi:MAG TPA: hypothetical protein VGB61_08520 [Pyrinomonadaceae bacterium]
MVRPMRCRTLSLLSLALLLGAGTTFAPARGQEPEQAPSPVARAKAEVPADLSKLDARALIREAAESERAMQPRRFEYTWTAKVTERESGKQGEVKKESVKVYEVYPVRGEFVRKLTSENGVAVSSEEAEKQFQKVVAQLEKVARAEEKRSASGAEKGSATTAALPPPTGATADASGILTFGFSNGFKTRSGLSTREFSFAPWRILRAGEFFSPRRESFKGREMIVLDFRPRADFVAADDAQKPYGKLAGRVWIDVADRALARIEAWPLALNAPGAHVAEMPTRPHEPSIVYEETRLPDGMWLESLVRINTAGHRAVFNGLDVNFTKEISDFKRFEASTGDAKVEPAQKQ